MKKVIISVLLIVIAIGVILFLTATVDSKTTVLKSWSSNEFTFKKVNFDIEVHHVIKIQTTYVVTILDSTIVSQNIDLYLIPSGPTTFNYIQYYRKDRISESTITYYQLNITQDSLLIALAH